MGFLAAQQRQRILQLVVLLGVLGLVHIANGNLQLQLGNEGRAPCTFTVRPRAYRDDGPWTFTVAPGESLSETWSLADSGAWYDFEITVAEWSGWRRRVAGRVETGRASVSDPAMGLGDRD